LNKEQKRTLTALLNLIIPASEDGKMPGANDIGFFTYMQNENILLIIQEGLIKIIDESHNHYGRGFSALSVAEQSELVSGLKGILFRFINILTTHVIHCYYQYDDVLKAIGLEARPPFPKGSKVEEGDIILLEPVYYRGKCYRD
jgi:hypothetical protein